MVFARYHITFVRLGNYIGYHGHVVDQEIYDDWVTLGGELTPESIALTCYILIDQVVDRLTKCSRLPEHSKQLKELINEEIKLNFLV
jgi:hypothetical protein